MVSATIAFSLHVIKGPCVPSSAVDSGITEPVWTVFLSPFLLHLISYAGLPDGSPTGCPRVRLFSFLGKVVSFLSLSPCAPAVRLIH